MPETYGVPEPEPTRQERAEKYARLVFAGHAEATVRRIVLWVVLFGFITLSLLVPPMAIPATIVAALLALTDQLL